MVARSAGVGVCGEGFWSGFGGGINRLIIEYVDAVCVVCWGG